MAIRHDGQSDVIVETAALQAQEKKNFMLPFGFAAWICPNDLARASQIDRTESNL